MDPDSPVMKFQFHHGTIGRMLNNYSSVILNNFNSTTVRLGVGFPCTRFPIVRISIPPRYDWEKVKFEIRNSTIHISIPPRYDWEYY